MISPAFRPKLAGWLSPRETTDQVERLERIFELIEQPAKGKACDAIKGMIDESQQVMKEFKGSAALDAGPIASARKRSSTMRSPDMGR